MIFRSLILLLFMVIVPIDSLTCYNCSCEQSNVTACDCSRYSTEYLDRDYCVIIEQRDISNTFIELSRIPRNASWIDVDDSYYILTIESIRYNQTGADWYLVTNGIIYGCDWDYCNSPDLIDKLPNSFALSIDKTWLNTNIYGTGSVNSCNFCEQSKCFNGTNPFNPASCPLTNCTNVTSCISLDLWSQFGSDEQCYSSSCAPSYLTEDNWGPYGGKYKVDIEAIVYLGRNRSVFDVWEIDVYCAVDNCTRITIFSEIKDELSVSLSDFSAFPSVRPTAATTTTTPRPISNPITCYQCECFNGISCECDLTTVASSDDGYCVIIRESFTQSIYIYSDFYSFYDADRFIYDFPFTLVEESINYDERGGRWNTQTNLVIYGCNWNLCNKHALIPLLPNSFQMRLPETWLNTSVLGSGQPVQSCHQCPDDLYCGDTDYLDANVCPIASCNTTCLVVDIYEEPENDYLCYRSSCLLPEQEIDSRNRHRIEIEGLIFASDPNTVELWEIDIYCRADNCSSPNIFRELRQQLKVDIGNIGAIFNETYDPTIPQRRCYDCYCPDPNNCTCDRATWRASNSTYCLIIRQYFGQDIWLDLGHIDRQSTRVNIREFPYLLVEESISYSEQTEVWSTLINYVIYGCDWDFCNHPSLAKYLPTSFQMRLPEPWLNLNIVGTGQPARDCHECPMYAICSNSSSIDGNLCPVQSCNTTCLVFDTFDDPSNALQCYQSFCAPPDSDYSEIDRHRLEIEGILYLRKQPREVEIWEIDIYCRADDCSRPEIFQEIKQQLMVDYGDLSVFDQIISTTTEESTTTGGSTPTATSTTTTTGSTPTATSTTITTGSTSVETTTIPGSASFLTNFNFLIMALISIVMFYLF